MFYTSRFRYMWFVLFLSFPNRILNRAKHDIVNNPSIFICYSALSTFRIPSLVRRTPIQTSYNLGIVFHDFHDFFGINVRHRFVHRFLMGDAFILGAISQRRASHFGDFCSRPCSAHFYPLPW